MYSRLHDGRWSTPVDVLASPDGGGVSGPSVALDEHGYLHLVWHGGLANSIYYSRAHVSEAEWATAWSTPQRLVDVSGSGTMGTPASIATSPENGGVHFIYASDTTLGDLFYRRSEDAGDTWSAPVAISNLQGTQLVADYPRALVDASGWIHVSWTELRRPNVWPPDGVYYARSSDHGRTWSEPTRVAPNNWGLLNMATTGGGAVHRVWHATASIGERRHQASSDGGDSWTVAQPVAPGLKGGFTGYPGLGVDSVGVLHTAIAGTLHGPGVYHVAWDGRKWSEPTYVSKGALGEVSVEQPALAISRGNELHVVYEEDFRRIWYTSRLVDAPTIRAREPLFTPPIAGRGDQPPTVTPPVSVQQPAPTLVKVELEVEPSPATPLLAGAIPSLLLAALAIRYATRHP